MVIPSPPANYGSAGPMSIKIEAGGDNCTIFRPAPLNDKAPVIIWGNGLHQSNTSYGPLLSGLASWGFVVAAVNTTSAGSGEEMLACLDWLTAQNTTEGSSLKGKLSLGRVGMIGHAEGGGGALNAGRDPRVRTTVALLPTTATPAFAADAATGQHGPMLLLSGGADTAAPAALHQRPVFDRAKTGVFWATRVDAGHMVPVNEGGGVFRAPIVGWFRAQLMNDTQAWPIFHGKTCQLCTNVSWKVQTKGRL